MVYFQERGKPDPAFASQWFRDGFRTFMLHYKPWLKSAPLDQPGHPWQAYRQPSPGTEGDERDTQREYIERGQDRHR